MLILTLLSCSMKINTNTYNRSYSRDFPVEYRSVLQTWDDKSVNDLMLRWGVPTTVFDIPNGNKVFEYKTDVSKLSFCTARFEIKDSIVVRSDMWGDACSLWNEPQKQTSSENSKANSVYVE